MNDLVNESNFADEVPIQWQRSLVLDVAMGVDEETICEVYELQFPQLQRIKQTASFKARLEAAVKDLEKEGASFRLKCQMQMEEYLKDSFAMVKANTTDPRVKLKIIEATARWAGYDKVVGEEASSGGGVGITVNIDLGNAKDATEKPVSGEVLENGN